MEGHGVAHAVCTDQEVSIPVCIDPNVCQDYQIRSAVIASVKAMVTEAWFLDIERAMADSYNRNFKIVDQPSGTAEDQGFCFGAIYIDQTSTGGLTGDDFAGTICIPLPNGKFLKFNYTM